MLRSGNSPPRVYTVVRPHSPRRQSRTAAQRTIAANARGMVPNSGDADSFPICSNPDMSNEIDPANEAAIVRVDDPAPAPSGPVEPGPASAAPAPPPTQPATAAATPADLPPLPFSFSGNASDYFRIWIVNLLFVLLSLGIWSAWAKVRKCRYFYGHTWVAGSNFELVKS